MKKIIEKIVRQEIRGIVARNEDSIREVVKTSVLPELRKAIRESISQVLEEMVEEENTLPKDTGFQTEKKPPTSDIGLRPGGAYPPASQARALRAGAPEGPRTSDIGPRTSDFGQSNGRYLYCIAEGNEAIDLGKIGIEDSQVYTISHDNLCAVVHNCPAEPYHSEDKEVVKHWVVTHQKVVDEAWERFGTVIPIGFDTIIQGNAVADPEENMKNWLRDDFDNLKAKMEKVRDRAEYGVQVFWDTKVMAQKVSEESLEVKNLEEEIKSKPRGLAYMYRQKLEELLKKEMEKQADRYFKEFYEKIKPHANDFHVEKTKKTEDENMQMLMNLSCLLPKEGTKGLGDELEKIDALEGFSVRYTGPWPPYSFV